jgi:hypothetical protein
MRDPARIERMLNLIKEIWTECPDMRLGQLLVNSNSLMESFPFFLEDSDLEKSLETYKENYVVQRL